MDGFHEVGMPGLYIGITSRCCIKIKAEGDSPDSPPVQGILNLAPPLPRYLRAAYCDHILNAGRSGGQGIHLPFHDNDIFRIRVRRDVEENGFPVQISVGKVLGAFPVVVNAPEQEALHDAGTLGSSLRIPH